MYKVYTEKANIEPLYKVVKGLLDVEFCDINTRQEHSTILLFGRNSVKRMRGLCALHHSTFIDIYLSAAILNLDIDFLHDVELQQLLQEIPIEELRSILIHAITNQKPLTPVENDWFFIAPPHNITVNFDEYWSDSKELKSTLKHALTRTDKISMVGGAGVGKNYFTPVFYELAKLPQIGCKSLVIVVPTQSILEQQCSDLVRRHYGNTVAAIYEKSTKEDRLKASEAPIIITTIHSLGKIKKSVLENALLVIDEHHKIAQDKSFQIKMPKWFLHISQAKKTVFISATPDFYLCSGVCNEFDFLFINTVTSSKNLQTVIQVNANIDNKNCKLLAANIAATRKQYPQLQDSTTVVYLDSKDALRAASKTLTDKHNLVCDVWTSDKSATSENTNNKNYQSVTKNGGVFSDAPNVLLMTKRGVQGVSIKNQCSFIDGSSTHYSSILQLINRARHNKKTGVNMNNTCFWFRKYKEHTTPPVSKMYNIKQYINNLVNKAKSKALTSNIVSDELQIIDNYTNQKTLKKDITKLTVYDDFYTNETKFCTVSILEHLYMLDLKHTGTDITLKRLSNLDSRISTKVSDIAANGLICDNYTQLKEQKKELKELTAHEIESNFVNFICALAHAPNYELLRERVQDLPQFNSFEVAEILSDKPELLSTDLAKKAVRTYLKCTWDNLVIDSDNIKNLILSSSHMTTKIIDRLEVQRRLQEYKKSLKGEPCNLDNRTYFEAAITHYFQQHIKVFIKNQRRKKVAEVLIATKKLESMYKKAVDKVTAALEYKGKTAYTKHEFIEVFKTLYEVGIKRMRGKTTCKFVIQDT